MDRVTPSAAAVVMRGAVRERPIVVCGAIVGARHAIVSRASVRVSVASAMSSVDRHAVARSPLVSPDVSGAARAVGAGRAVRVRRARAQSPAVVSVGTSAADIREVGAAST